MTIQTLIDKQDNFEIIRDQIAQILADEVASQMALATLAARDPELWNLNVYSERANPWEQWLNNVDTAPNTPIVNVWFDNESFDMSKGDVVQRQMVNGTFNIDCYGFGISSDDGATGHNPGDELAAKESHRAVRLVRNILMSSGYTYLELRGIVGRRWPESITTFQPQQDTQIVQNVVATRFSLGVQFNEFSPQYLGEALECIHTDLKRDGDGFILAQLEYFDGCAAVSPGCVPTHLDNTFWTPGSAAMTWSAVDNRWNGGDDGTLLPVGGWVTGYQPANMAITVSAPNASTGSFPFVVTVVLRDQFSNVIGTGVATLADEFDLQTSVIPLSWDIGAEIDGLFTDVPKYVNAANINCIGFV